MKYPISKEDKAALVASQENRCAICRHEFTERRVAAVDHDHISGEVRGALCGSCNRSIGLFAESPEALCAAAEYVTFHRSHIAALKGYDPMHFAPTWVVLERTAELMAIDGYRKNP